MICSVCGSENIVTDTKFLEQFDEPRMVVFVDIFRSFAQLVCLDRDGCAVRVRAADHQDISSPQAMVSGNDIPRQMWSSDVPHVDIRVGIRPGNGDQNVLSHGKTPQWKSMENFIIHRNKKTFD